jgi:hypothetical protein
MKLLLLVITIIIISTSSLLSPKGRSTSGSGGGGSFGVAAEGVHPPSPCFLPAEFTAGLNQMIIFLSSNQNDDNYNVDTHRSSGMVMEINIGIISVSFTQQKVRYDIMQGEVLQRSGGGGSKQQHYQDITIFEDFKNQEMLIVDHQTGSCSSLPIINYQMGPNQIPSDAKYLGEFILGSQLAIREYAYEFAIPSNINNDNNNNNNNGANGASVGNLGFLAGLTTGNGGACSIYNVEVFYNSTLLLTEAFYNFVPSVNPYTLDDIPSSCYSLSSSYDDNDDDDDDVNSSNNNPERGLKRIEFPQLQDRVKSKVRSYYQSRLLPHLF